MTTVLDASALLRFLDDEAGAERVERLLNEAISGDLVLLMSAVNWGEVIYAVAHRQGLSAATELLNKLSGLRIAVVPCSSEDAAEAALFKARYKIPYADAFAACLAKQNSAALVTADYDFKTIPAGMLKIEFLPRKS
ncbi:MAG: PIN domain nuclease [Acidobacteria bacterium]|nr:MAG: PIN domain nuclease [Acidobacteriota bacterium]